LEVAASEAAGAAHSLRGRLKVNADPWFARLVLAPRLLGFLDAHPQVSLELLGPRHARRPRVRGLRCRGQVRRAGAAQAIRTVYQRQKPIWVFGATSPNRESNSTRSSRETDGCYCCISQLSHPRLTDGSARMALGLTEPSVCPDANSSSAITGTELAPRGCLGPRGKEPPAPPEASRTSARLDPDIERVNWFFAVFRVTRACSGSCIATFSRAVCPGTGTASGCRCETSGLWADTDFLSRRQCGN
jgi:hypothetical protein